MSCLFCLFAGLLAKMSEQEAFKPVSKVRIVIIVAMVIMLLVGISASLVLAKVLHAQSS